MASDVTTTTAGAAPPGPVLMSSGDTGGVDAGRGEARRTGAGRRTTGGGTGGGLPWGRAFALTGVVFLALVATHAALGLLARLGVGRAAVGMGAEAPEILVLSAAPRGAHLAFAGAVAVGFAWLTALALAGRLGGLAEARRHMASVARACGVGAAAGAALVVVGLGTGLVGAEAAAGAFGLARMAAAGAVALWLASALAGRLAAGAGGEGTTRGPRPARSRGLRTGRRCVRLSHCFC